MTVERKFAGVFMAPSASGNIRVIKFRDDGGNLLTKHLLAVDHPTGIVPVGPDLDFGAPHGRDHFLVSSTLG